MLLSLFDIPVVPAPVVTADPGLQQEFEIEVNGENVPVRILVEQRFNNRVLVNKNGILLRINARQNKEEQRKHIDSLLKWAKDKLGDKPELLESLPQRTYMNGELLKVGEQDFIISIFHHDGPKSTARIFKNNIVLSVAKGLNKDVEANTCSYLVSKCLCKFFQPLVSQRLHDFNNRFFKKQLNSVKMKYATSFWGHCSYTGHIVISVRLMFAPHSVVDYVLLHELAHLVHHDHSSRFWKLVETVMPNYRNAELHLKEHHLKYYL
jgi:predicted metal-dependent hydrolase